MNQVAYRPQIETKYGLMYEDELVFAHRWSFLPTMQECKEIVYEEIYTLKGSPRFGTEGEVVKHSAAKYLNQAGVQSQSELGAFNQSPVDGGSQSPVSGIQPILEQGDPQ